MQVLLSNIKNILTFNYWFNLSPGPFLPLALKILYIFFGLILIIGIASKFVSKKHKNYPPLRNIYQKFYYYLTSMAVFGLILVFLRQQNVYFLSAPFWFIIWLVSALLWLFFIIRYITVKVPKVKEEIELKKEMDKYLP